MGQPELKDVSEDVFYRAFEDRFRGTRELILDRLGVYLPFVRALAAEGDARALDLGCGRGEWLELLGREGIEARGVDLDENMLAPAMELGLAVTRADALETLRAEPDASLAIVSAHHLVEHVPFEMVLELMVEARRALRPGGLLILETPNPENLVVGTMSFHLDPTHIAPIPPLRLSFMAEFAGFARNSILRLNGPEPARLRGMPVGLIDVMTDVSVDYAVVAQVAGPDMAALDEDFERRVGTDLSQAILAFDSTLETRLRTVGEAADIRASAAIDPKLAELRNGLKGTGAELADIRAGLVSTQARLEQDLSPLHRAMGETTTGIAGIHRVLEGTGTEIADIHRTLEDTGTELADVHRTLEEAGTELGDLHRALAGTGTEMADIRTGLVSVQARLGEDVPSLRHALEEAGTEIAGLRSDLDALRYAVGRSWWQRLLFRPDGRPVRLLRRLLFHNNGCPRGGILRRLVVKGNGTPRPAFARWIGSDARLARSAPPVHAIEAAPVPAAAPVSGQSLEHHPRREEIRARLASLVAEARD